MSNKKDNNFSKAMYDMFGVGSDSTETEEPVFDTADTAEPKAYATGSVTPVVKPSYASGPATYLAPDTVMEGTLHTKGDVEIAGTFTGDIISEGDVTLHTSVTGNVSARNMALLNCALTGECTVTESADINAGSTVTGNITAKELRCSGAVYGDTTASGNVVLSSSARIKGNITAKALSVEPGAAIDGKLTIS